MKSIIHTGIFIGCSVLWASCTATNQTPQKAPEVAPSKPVEKAESSDPAVKEIERPEDPDAVYQMRQMHLVEWIEKAKRDCERMRNTDAWLPERDGFLPEEIALVKTRCAEAVEVGLRGDAWIKSMSACADRYARAKGQGKHECRLTPKDVPDVPPEMFELHKAACTTSCARAGAEAIELAKERSQFVHCCDGTTSPSCTYGAIHSGCCAKHGGVCIE